MYTIGEVAQRSGFSASALRFYEDIGLVAPATRTDAGYRIYDEHTLARLGFIARAKQLGCSLDEITDLVEIWDGQRCGPVQQRFHRLVTDKIADTYRQIDELTALTAQLQDAAAQLAEPAVDGPCGPGCACLSAAPLEPVRIELRPKSIDPPIACTLDSGAIPDRLADWRAVLDHATSRTTTADGGMRIELDGDLDIAELTGLVAAEQHCCAFYTFAIIISATGVALEVRAPDAAADLVDRLTGPATPR